MRKMILGAMLAGLTIMVLLTVGTACLAATEKIELRPKGYCLMNEAYVVPLADGRDTVELIETQASELNTLRSYVSSQDAALEAVSTDISALEAAQAKERAAWQSSAYKLQRSLKKQKSPWALGIFAGYDAVHSNASIGVGLVYSFWRF